MNDSNLKIKITEVLDEKFNFSIIRGIDVARGILSGISESGKIIPIPVVKDRPLACNAEYKEYNNENVGERGGFFAQNNLASTADADAAFVPEGATKLSLRYGVVFRKPRYHQAESYAQKTVSNVEKAMETDVYTIELAKRYFWNMINGRTLWRNRIGSDIETLLSSPSVRLKNIKWPVTIHFSEGDISTYIPGYEEQLTVTYENDGQSVQIDPVEFCNEIFQAISDALRGKRMPAIFSVDNRIDVIAGLPVYPSQEFLPGASKTLYVVEQNGIKHAALHSQKIGNAIRTIDNWYGKDDNVMVTPVEFFGFNKEQGVALRHVKNAKRTGQTLCIYYHILDNAEHLSEVLSGKAPMTSQDHKDILYLLAVMCRGGILNPSEKEKKDSKKKKEGAEA